MRLTTGCICISAAIAASALRPLTAQIRPATAFEKTTTDVNIRTATGWLDQISSELFAQAGERYLTPRVVGYDNNAVTGCGRIEADNAYACRSDRTIYYDRTFLAGLVSATASKLHTDGDMAAIFAIAHEWGHELQYLLGLDYTNAVDRSESDADCLGGVLLSRAERLGKLQAGDMEEARFSIGFIGDSVLVPGEWGKVIEQINANAPIGAVPVITNAKGYHGNANERLAAFNRGLTTTMRTCVAGIPRPK